MNKKPSVTLEQPRGTERTYPASPCICGERGIRENAARFKQAFSWNKGYKEYFAVKTTPNPFLLNILKDIGYGTDCSSMTEPMISRVRGFSGPGIMFSSNDTPPEEFAYAKKLGVIISLDDITHIQYLEKALGYIPETISCRFNPDGLFEISNDIMDNPGDSKYGMTAEQTGQASKIPKEKGVKHFGTHAFLASNTVINEYYPILAKILFELVVKLKEEAGVHIASVNLSDGIGIPYRPDQEFSDILTVGGGIRRVYEGILVPASMEDVALCTELERFMMGPYDALVTKAIREKYTYKKYTGVDACAMSLVWSAMYGAYHYIIVMGREDEPCTHMYGVVGSLCESNNKFAIDRILPKIRRGDLLSIHDAGAHGLAMGYNYNGKLKSVELLLKEDGTVEMIHRTETPKDYFTIFDFCDILRDTG